MISYEKEKNGGESSVELVTGKSIVPDVYLDGIEENKFMTKL
jgi:hypothetical protein